MVKRFLIFMRYIFIILICFFTLNGFLPSYSFSQQSNILDSTKIDSIKKITEIDSSAISISQDDTAKTSLEKAVSDSNAGKELLALSSKKDKFAYFDTTQSYKRVLANNSFDVGEELTFNIRYGPIVAGYATMSIPEIVTINNFECYHIISEARSNRFFSAFFKVRDRVESFMDKDGLFSWRFEKHLREGKYRKDQYVEYNHINRLAITDKKDTLRIPPCIQDILTAFYYVRTLPLEIGKSIFIDNHANRKLYPLEIKVHRKERIRVKAGTFDCIVIEPILRSDAIFKQRGRLLIWMTDDYRKIPVQMKSKVLIGSITAELKEMKGIQPTTNHVEL